MPRRYKLPKEQSENYRLGVKIGDALNGTADSPENKLEQYDLDESLIDDADFCLGLDNTTMRCVRCDWYVGADEVVDDDSGQPVCPDCVDD